MHDLSVFRYWDQMSCAPVVSLCTNGISWGIAMLTQAFGWVGGKSQGDKNWDCFSSCSSCWTNGWGGGVAGAIPGSQDALTWPLQLAVGKQSDVFSTQREEPTAKPLLVPPSWPGSMQGWWERWKEPKEERTCHMPTKGRTCGPKGKEHHDWQASVAVFSNNEHPNNSYTHARACPALAVQPAHHCRWIPAQKIAAQLGSWRNSL